MVPTIQKPERMADLDYILYINKICLYLTVWAKWSIQNLDHTKIDYLKFVCVQISDSHCSPIVIWSIIEVGIYITDSM